MITILSGKELVSRNLVQISENNPFVSMNRSMIKEKRKAYLMGRGVLRIFAGNVSSRSAKYARNSTRVLGEERVDLLADFTHSCGLLRLRRRMGGSETRARYMVGACRSA